MEPLDLTKEPPRSPYAKLEGLLMLARTIDKMRALLPGGNTGVYKIKGFSKMLLNALGIPEDDMQAVVSLAATDDEVAAWVSRHSDASKYDEINARLEQPTVGESLGRPGFLEKYPVAKTLSPDTSLLRMLELDDEGIFGLGRPSSTRA
jgi:Domain of unknown function (DUF5069)